MKTIETLISTMNRNNIDFLTSMNIQSDTIIGNQNGKNDILSLTVNDKNVLLVNSSTKGLSRNRNITIRNASADICVIADDDIEYCSDYVKIIRDAFSKYEDADVIIFNLYEDPIERYVIKKWHRVRGIEFLRYGSVRIAFKRDSISGKIIFDERFGAGGEIPIGEDTIFLGDCLKKRLKIYASPEYILKLEKGESSWFDGYNKSYFENKGKMYYRIFGILYWVICLQDVVRHKNLYRKCGSTKTIFSYMKYGAKEYKRFL